MPATTQPSIEKHWKANPGKQEQFLALPDSIFEQFYGGAAGGGKSESLLMKPLLKQWTDVRGFKGLILRRTFRELEESLIQRSATGKRYADGSEAPSFGDFGATYNKTDKRWTFPSGATITFGHAEEESDVRKYDTAEYQYIAFDELTSFTEFQYNFLAFSRCRSTDPSLPANVCSASNPGNIGHGWVRKRFVEPYPKGGKIMVQNIKGVNIKRIFIQAFLYDNPKLMENDPLYITRLEMLTEAEKKAKLYGDWWTFSGQVFDEWRLDPFPDEPANAKHIYPQFTPEKWLPRILSIDWGFKAMMHAIYGALYPNHRAVIYKEHYCEKTAVKVWTAELANICLQEGIVPYIFLDPSAWQNRDGKPISDQFIEAWREVTLQAPLLFKATNDRLGGKMLVHEYLRWRPRPKFSIITDAQYDVDKASWILRNAGLEAFKKYQSSFIPDETDKAENLPRLIITDGCRVLNKTIPLCVYAGTKSNGKNVEDVAEFDGDDPYDNLRYFVQGCETFPELAQSALKVEAKKQEVVQAYAQSNDINAFYRRMEYIEAKQKKQTIKFIPIGRRKRIA